MKHLVSSAILVLAALGLVRCADRGEADERNFHLFGMNCDPCVIFDGGRYRMWFSVVQNNDLDGGPVPDRGEYIPAIDQLNLQGMAYSESVDGVNWSDPKNLLNKEFARVLDPLDKVIFSTTLKHGEESTRIARTNVAEEVLTLKQRPGKDIFIESLSIASWLSDRGLIDEYHFVVHSVVAGKGPRLFDTVKPVSSAALPIDIILSANSHHFHI